MDQSLDDLAKNSRIQPGYIQTAPLMLCFYTSQSAMVAPQPNLETENAQGSMTERDVQG